MGLSPAATESPTANVIAGKLPRAATLVLTEQVTFTRGNRGAKRIHRRVHDPVIPTPAEAGRVPRISQLMALAIKFDGMLERGEVFDYAEISRLGYVTRARVTQIMNMLHLAPDIQEDILFLPKVEKGRAQIHERLLRRLIAMPDWANQRIYWSRMLSKER